MSTALLVGIIIILLVVGVPIGQALIQRIRHRRSLRIPAAEALVAAAIRRGDLPAGFRLAKLRALTSESIAWSAGDPADAMRELNDAGHIVSFRQQYRDPRSFGEFVDVLLANTLRRSAPQRRIGLTLSRYQGAEQAEQALDRIPDLAEQDIGVRVEDITRSGDELRAREWTRVEDDRTTQRMLQLRWRDGEVVAELEGDSEPPDALDDDLLKSVAQAVRSRLKT